jgi:hypothetical protein
VSGKSRWQHGKAEGGGVRAAPLWRAVRGVKAVVLYRGLRGLSGPVVLGGLPKLPYIMPVDYGKRSDT